MSRTKRTLALRLLLCVTLLMCSLTAALAQSANTDEYPKVEVFIGYSALGEANSRGISFGSGAAIGAGAIYATPTGFEFSVIRNFSNHFGLKADFSAHFRNAPGHSPITSCTPACTTVTQEHELKTRVYNYLGGPEFKARNHTRFTPFVHALAGVAHTSATLRTTGPPLNFLLKTSDNSFAMALGGGLDIRATKRVSFRGSVDYNPVFVGDSISGTRDLVRFSLGVLFH
jgi:opacity protein-like surface antigen